MTEFQVGADAVVTIHYTLKDDAGTVIDSSRDGDPFAYLHGHQNIVPGLERQLEGKSPGDSVQAVVQPEEGYGPRIDNAEMAVPRSELPADADLQVGMQLMAQEAENSQPRPVWIAAVDGDSVTMDFNHPLAGVTLHFDVEILEIRAAEKQELEHGHPHGPGGHHH